MQRRPLTTVLFEALVVGVSTLIVFLAFQKLGFKRHWATHVAGGALIHLIYEYLGMNQWWCAITYPRK